MKTMLDEGKLSNWVCVCPDRKITENPESRRKMMGKKYRRKMMGKKIGSSFFIILFNNVNCPRVSVTTVAESEGKQTC